MRTESGATTQSEYAYDALGQIVTFTQSNDYAKSYAYDKVGNMTQKALCSKAYGKLTKIGLDGRATKVGHNVNHGKPQYHTEPHDYDITWNSDGTLMDLRHMGDAINYPNVVPPF